MEVMLMSAVFRSNRKATDEDIVRLNSVGLSLSTIAKVLGCHPTTITLRLKSLGVPSADTRRTFMEDIFITLDTSQQEWLADQLHPSMSIKDYVRGLLVDAYKNSAKNENMTHEQDV